jgi:hypothetical protein
VNGHNVAAAEQILQELEEEARASWEERAVFYATRITNLGGEEFETLNETKWSRRDCTEYQDELDWEMRTFCRICNELDPLSLLAKMRRAAQLREDRVKHEYLRTTRVVGRILQAPEGRPQETGGPAVGGSRRDEMDCPDEFLADYGPEGRMEYEKSVPRDRWPTLLVADILGAGFQEEVRFLPGQLPPRYALKGAGSAVPGDDPAGEYCDPDQEGGDHGGCLEEVGCAVQEGESIHQGPDAGDPEHVCDQGRRG